MNLCSIFLAVLLSFAVLPAFADEPTKIEELGLDQKLQRLYELYRSGETVSLKTHESRFNLGISYAFNDKNDLGLHTSNRSLVLQGSFAYGITDRLEAAISVPMQWNQNRIETPEKIYVHQSLAGLGDMGVRFITTFPVKQFEMTGVFGLAFPTGRAGIGQSGIRSTIGINVAKIVRPAFLFGGLGWQRDWHTGVNGITYSGGVGFYLNHVLSAGMELSGTRFLNPPRSGIYDSASAIVQVSYQLTPTLGITPYVSHGLTDGTPNVVGFTISRRF